MDDEILKQMLAIGIKPEIVACLATVDAIAGYEISKDDQYPFLYFHSYLTSPPPRFVSDWRRTPSTEKRYVKFASGILHDVRNTFACVLYHYDRLKGIESAVIEGLDKHNYRSIVGNSTMALGNTLAWDFEYQAFILAFRRCLDYLARAICTYFKNDFHSFRRLSGFLSKIKPAAVAQALIPIIDKYQMDFDFVLSDGERKSVRDKISHYEYVSAGVINLSRHGFVFAGGGENLGSSHATGAKTLSEVLDEHVKNLRSCMRELICQYVDSMRNHHAADA